MKTSTTQNNHNQDIAHIADFEEVLIGWSEAIECYATLYKKVQIAIIKSTKPTNKLEQIRDETISILECLLSGTTKPYLDVNDLKNHTKILQKQNQKTRALLTYLA